MVKLGDIRIMEMLEPEFFGGVLNHNIVIKEGGPSGGLLMIDTGLPGYLDAIENHLKAWGFSVEDISDIVITHWHHDHSGNASEIRRISKAKVYAHVNEIDFLRSPSKYDLSYDDVKDFMQISKQQFESTAKRINELKYESVYVDFPLKGGEVISKFKVIYVPGHTRGHIALFDGSYLITGDAVRGVNGVPSPPLRFFSWDYRLALESYNKLISLPYSVLVPYHGEVIYRW
ncbi:MBL fold metallo-hydrolase [Metallosphaera cuprina]|nr:MBL fold metallo-hydrolase [Metallosphaera cuprina]